MVERCWCRENRLFVAMDKTVVQCMEAVIERFDKCALHLLMVKERRWYIILYNKHERKQAILISEVLGTSSTTFLRYHFGIFNEKTTVFFVVYFTWSEGESLKNNFKTEYWIFFILVEERSFGTNIFMIIKMVEAEIWDRVYFYPY